MSILVLVSMSVLFKSIRNFRDSSKSWNSMQSKSKSVSKFGFSNMAKNRNRKTHRNVIKTGAKGPRKRSGSGWAWWFVALDEIKCYFTFPFRFSLTSSVSNFHRIQKSTETGQLRDLNSSQFVTRERFGEFLEKVALCKIQIIKNDRKFDTNCQKNGQELDKYLSNIELEKNGRNTKNKIMI